MAESRLKIDLRRAEILKRLREEGSVSVLELAADLGSTAVTIRNDLATLERDGYLTRTRGGARYTPRTQACAAPPSGMRHEAEKRSIARAVAALVKDGNTIFINTGTTTGLIAEALTAHHNLNFVTNSLEIASQMGAVPSFHVILLGGKINAQHGFTFGTDVSEQLLRYHADLCILSIDGICAPSGISTHLAEEAIIDRTMLARASGCIIAADHSKVGRVGFTNIQRSLSGFTLVTDECCAPEALHRLEEEHMSIHIAPS